VTDSRHKVIRLAAGWLLAVCCAAAGAEAIDVRIGRLLSEARSAASSAGAEAKLRQAEKLLDEAGGGIDSTARGFLHADILRARGRRAVMDWKRDPTTDALREKARKNLHQAIDEYARLVKVCEDRLDGLEARLGHADPSRSQRWRVLTGQISRANYCEAWSHYNLGLIAEDGAGRKRRFNHAIERFSSFTAGDYRNHPIVADCFLGQALCHYELKQHFQVLELLKPVRASNTPAGTFKRMTYLLIKSAQAYGSYLAAENAAKRYFDALPASHKLDVIELGMALERARCLSRLADPRQNPEYHKLFRGRLDAVAKTIYSHGDPWRAELAGILGRSTGATPFKCLSRARALFKSGKFAEAAAEAEKGIAAATNKTDPVVLADLRYARAAAIANQNQPLETFRAAADFLRRHPGDRRAGGLCRTALLAGRGALKATPNLPPGEFLEFLAWMEKQFPARPEVKQLPWYRAAVSLDAGRFRQVERLLGPVRADSPVYLLAQYGLAVAAAKQAEALARDGKADPNAMAGLLDRSAGAAGRFVEAAAGREMSAPERQAAGIVVDVAVATARRYLELPSPASARALALLEKLDGLSSHRGRAARRRLALRGRAHVLSGDVEAAGQCISKLLDSPAAADGQAARAFADMVGPLAERFDRLTEAGKADAAARLGGQIVRMQNLLLRYVTESTDPAVRRREAAVRLALAEMLRKLARHAEAVGQYQWLLRNTPQREAGAAIRGLAICQEEMRRYGLAAGRWRVLANGLKKNTNGWCEARYHWIRCLYRDGRRDQARKLLKYFRLQHPKIAVGEWQAAFDALGEEIGGAAAASRPGGGTQ